MLLKSLHVRNPSVIISFYMFSIIFIAVNSFAWFVACSSLICAYMYICFKLFLIATRCFYLTLGTISLSSSPGLDFETVPQYTLLIMVVDSGGLSDTATLIVNVTDVNEQPVITNLPNVPGSLSLFENHTGVVYMFQVNATDVDGDGLVYSFTSSPAGAPFTISATGRRNRHWSIEVHAF